MPTAKMTQLMREDDFNLIWSEFLQKSIAKNDLRVFPTPIKPCICFLRVFTHIKTENFSKWSLFMRKQRGDFRTSLPIPEGSKLVKKREDQRRGGFCQKN